MMPDIWPLVWRPRNQSSSTNPPMRKTYGSRAARVKLGGLAASTCTPWLRIWATSAERGGLRPVVVYCVPFFSLPVMTPSLLLMVAVDTWPFFTSPMKAE